jgi:dienelactone hydrolase
VTIETYQDLNRKMTEHFQAGEFQQALDLVEREGGRFPDNRPLVDYWTMCAATRVDNRARMYEVADKFHNDGFWYGEMMWRMTPSFKLLQGEAEFERLVAKSAKIQSNDVFSRSPIMLEFSPRNASKKSPLLITLHGNQNTANGTLPFWNPAVDAGFVLAVPQSTQAMFKDAYIWDDLDASFKRVKNCFDALKKESEFDPKRVILAGHSMGGLIAIQMVMTGELPVRGFIANGPALPFEDAPEELEKALASAKKNGLRGYFIMGDKDDLIERDAIRAFVEKMKSAGIPCELEIVPGATHDYHSNYDAALLNALKFVNL